MKRIILLMAFALCAVAYTAEAQAVKVLLSSYGFTTDTVSNTGTGYVELINPSKVGETSTTLIQFRALEISGTTAGTIALHGSLDGVTYASISSTTFTATDVTTPQSGTWILTGNPALYYRVTWTGTGTMAASISAKVFTK